MFQDPSKINSERNTLPFSNFLNEVENGRVVEVQIQESYLMVNHLKPIPQIIQN